MARVYVLFAFDVEDYIGPETDDGLMRLLEIFETQRVQANWKLVGEKLRVMESRGRRDILRALAQQDVGYHTNLHSCHPTVAEYLQDKPWDEGIKEFAERERPGYDDIQRIFGRSPVCYGQPGDSWAPHVFPVLREWGIPLYLDVGDHVGLIDQPFWYCGVLNVFRLRSNRARVDLRSGPESLEEAKGRFATLVDRLRPTGGVVEILYHPCEFVNTTFICSVNFARGANPPREAWRPAPLKPREEIQEGFRRLKEYLAFIQSQPEVEILSGTEFVRRAPDRARTRAFTREEIVSLAEAMRGEITWQELDDAYVSPGEIFGLVSEALASYAEVGSLPARLRAKPDVLGPAENGRDAGDRAEGGCHVDELLAACQAVERTLNMRRRLPTSVDIASSDWTPADFLATAAELLLSVAAGRVPERVTRRRGNFNPTRYVGGPDTWRWGVLPDDFNGDRLLTLGGLQTWTLKPAGVDYR